MNMNISTLAIRKWEVSKSNKAENAREAAYHMPFVFKKAPEIAEDLVSFDWDSLMADRSAAKMPSQEKAALYDRDLFGLSKILNASHISDATRGYLQDVQLDLQYEKNLLEVGFEEGVFLFS